MIAPPLNASVMRPLDLSAFESAVLKWIAARSGDDALKHQVANVQVVERDYTVVGCYTTLMVASDVPPSSGSYANHGPLEGPSFRSDAVEHGGGTLLWFRSGRADCLEIYAHGDYFPAEHAELGEFVLYGESESTA